MILVTVGNYLPFPRLIAAVDDLKRRGVIREEVFLQVGRAPDFKSEVCTYAQFLTPAEYARRMKEATVVISHGGAGTLIDALVAGKAPVVVPRQKKYAEHVDDHQMQFSEALSKDGRAIIVYEVAELPGAIEQARERGRQPPPESPRQMIELVERAIAELLTRRSKRRSSTFGWLKRS